MGLLCSDHILEGSLQPKEHFTNNTPKKAGSQTICRNRADKVTSERKKEMKGNVKVILSRNKKKKETNKERKIEDYFGPQKFERIYDGDPLKPAGKVKDLILSFERKK